MNSFHRNNNVITYKTGMSRDNGDSGEAERSFRRDSERHSGMNPNTIEA
jgi:hypothetical protein